MDADQAPVVRRIFAEYGAGLSPSIIAERLNADGVAAPQGRAGTTTYWRASTLYGDRKCKNGILQNRLYVGEFVFNRTRKVVDPCSRRALIRPNPESEWMVEHVPELRIVGETSGRRRRRSSAQSRDARLNSPPSQAHAVRAGVVRNLRRRVDGPRPRPLGLLAPQGGWDRRVREQPHDLEAPDEARVLSGLQDRMLDPVAVSEYVREHHLEHARRSKELAREGEQLRKRLRDAVAKVERLVMAVADGADEFVEIREVLGKARAERDSLAGQLERVEQLPVVALHLTITADYRAQVADLSSIARSPEARVEAISGCGRSSNA